MSNQDDFQPDPSGLQESLDLLINKRSEVGRVQSAPASTPPMWPDEGMGGTQALAALAPAALDDVARLDHPGFLAHMDPPTPWFTWAAAMWAASTNQNLLHSETAPSARNLEACVIDWMAPAFGMDGGHLSSGSTVANLTALWAARDGRGARRVIASSAAHISVRKSAHILGLGYEEIAVDDDQRMRLELLPDDLADAVVVLTAGTTAAGAIDPLQTPLDAAWTHIDAAWAGPLRFSSSAQLLDGVERADSVAMSAHKWLYQPKECAMVLFAETDAANEALSFTAGYLRHPNVGLAGSHGNAALPLATTLLAWGREGLRRRLDTDMARASILAELVRADPDLELRAQPVTGIVNWRARDCDPATIRQHLDDAWVSVAEIDGQQWLRSVLANPHGNPEHVVAAVKRAAVSSG